jgi:hypothetical protein
MELENEIVDLSENVNLNEQVDLNVALNEIDPTLQPVVLLDSQKEH